MATRAAMAARQATASGAIEKSVERIAAKLKIDVPAPGVVPYRDAEARAAVQAERVAWFLGQVAASVGADVSEEPPFEPVQPAVDERTPNDEEPEHTGEGEPSFAGRPLSSFEGMNDDAIIAIDGIGPARLKQIRKAQKD